MLTDTLREGAHGKVFKVLFWIIILSFVFAGVGNYLIPRLNTDPVQVGDFKITANSWNEQYNRRTQMMQRNYGPQAAALLENPQYVQALRMNVLEAMIDNVALNSATWKAGIRIGDEQVKEAIRQDTTFHKDGKFDNDTFLAVVRNMGASPDYYGEQLRVDLMAETVAAPVVRISSAVMPYESEALAKIIAQTRTVDMYSLDPQAIRGDTQVSDEEVQQFYDSHHDNFMTRASSSFNYVVLSVDELKKEVKTDGALIEEYFNMHQDEFTAPEKRSVSQILLKAGDDLDARVAKVEEELKKGSDFASVARQFSEDANTADKGGELGTLARNELGDEYANAVFSLKEAGQVTETVTDDYGAHIFRVNAIEPSHVMPYDSVKSEVRTAYIDSEARKLYNDRLATLSDVSFENPDSLDATAKALNLEVKDSGPVYFGDKSGQWPLNQDEMQKAAFKEDNITSNNNSNAISLGDDAAAVLNVYKYEPAKLQKLEDVKAQAQEQALNAKLTVMANKTLSDFDAAREKDPNAALPAHVVKLTDALVERAGNKFSPDLTLSIFALPKEPAQSSVLTMNGSVPTLVVLKSVDLDKSNTVEDFQSMIVPQLMQYKGQRAQGMLYKAAREISEVEYNQDAINLVNSQNSVEQP